MLRWLRDYATDIAELRMSRGSEAANRDTSPWGDGGTDTLEILNRETGTRFPGWTRLARGGRK